MKQEFMISCIGILALISCLLLAAAIPIGAQHADFPNLTGPHFGQKPPGMTPEIFAPGIVSSTGFVVFKGSFTPDGNEQYFYRHALPEVIPTRLTTFSYLPKTAS